MNQEPRCDQHLWRAWYAYNGRVVEEWFDERNAAMRWAKNAGGHWRHMTCQGRDVYRTRDDALAALRESPDPFAYVERCDLGEGTTKRRDGEVRPRTHHWHILTNEYAAKPPSSHDRWKARQDRRKKAA